MLKQAKGLKWKNSSRLLEEMYKYIVKNQL